jgi:hypothetical protein
MRVFQLLVIVQSIYTLITAVWPIIHIESFMEVTGSKTDVWLVKTVGALLIPVAVCLLTYVFIDTDKRPALALGGLTSVAFICIDFYYSLTDVISDIYMADGFLQILFLIVWSYIGLRRYDMLVAS